MNSPEISINTILASAYQPSLIFDSKVNTATKHYDRYKPGAAPDVILVQEVIKPLTTINLSLEMLKKEIKDEDLNIYLDVIMRSSARINNLISELLKCQEVEGLQQKM